jgi:putative hydrolase of the HAD superfamily
MARPRPALIFDFGNVFAFFDYSRACQRYAASLGLTGPKLLSLLRERGLMDVVVPYEQGLFPSEEFIARVGKLAGLRLDPAEFAADWADIFELNAPVAALVARLGSRGYRLALGSNTNEIHARHFRAKFAEALRPFGQLVLSYEIGHVKPSAAFYQACALAVDAELTDCVFIDDMPENVAGARSAGLQAIHFRDLPCLLDDLRALGVDVAEPAA